MKEFPALFIVNEDNSSQGGTHWTSIYLISSDKAFYFDSFGLKPNMCISNYLINFKAVVINDVTFQPLTSNACGHFCIYFVISICNGLYINDVLRTLSKQSNPDYFVKHYVFSLTSLYQ